MFKRVNPLPIPPVNPLFEEQFSSFFPRLVAEPFRDIISRNKCRIDSEKGIILIEIADAIEREVLFVEGRSELAKAASWLGSNWIQIFLNGSSESPRTLEVKITLYAETLKQSDCFSNKSPPHKDPAAILPLYESIQGSLEACLEWIMKQSKPIALTQIDTQIVLAVNKAYAIATKRPHAQWFGDSQDASRFQVGELERLDHDLRCATDGLLYRYRYRAAHWLAPAFPLEFGGNFQLLNLEGRWYRLGEFWQIPDPPA